MLRLIPLLVAGLALSACGNTDSSASPARPPTATATGPVTVALSEWSIAPSTATAAAGKVTFTATNAGKVPHEMVVIRTDKPEGALGKGKRVPETGSAGEIGEIKAGDGGKVTLTLKPGKYSLICNLPGHYALGMHTGFTVR
jgi:uncharacterized cupredoxin-like copper-binding protein